VGDVDDNGSEAVIRKHWYASNLSGRLCSLSQCNFSGFSDDKTRLSELHVTYGHAIIKEEGFEADCGSVAPHLRAPGIECMQHTFHGTVFANRSGAKY
jgi:hypothetical protein